MAVHQRLGLGERIRVTAFDRIGRQREGRAGKADERDATGKLGLDLTDGDEHVPQRLAGLEYFQAVDVRGCVDWPLELRSFTLDEVERQAHRLEWQQQVREQDRRVHIDAPDGLERHFGCQVRVCANLEERVTLPECAVLRHVPSGLSHEPDRRAVNGLASTGFEETGFSHARARSTTHAPA